MSEQHITVLGGGTGTRAVLSGLRELPVEVTGVINMSDDGGSSGTLRRELDGLPPGDVRQAIAALSRAPAECVAAFERRYTAEDNPKLAGHPIGNLLIAEWAAERGFMNAVKGISRVLDVKGSVIPVTEDAHDLCAAIDGHTVVGEHNIGQAAMASLPELWLDPLPVLHDEAYEAIERADLVVVAPGDLYGSLAPTLLVDGIAKALAARRGRLVYVSNIINKPLQTQNFTTADYTSELERFIGEPCIDVVLQHAGEVPLAWFAEHAQPGEALVGAVSDMPGKQLRDFDMINYDLAVDPGASVVPKSFVRHDGSKVAGVLMELLNE